MAVLQTAAFPFRHCTVRIENGLWRIEDGRQRPFGGLKTAVNDLSFGRLKTAVNGLSFGRLKTAVNGLSVAVVEGARTPDLRVQSATLFQLSYTTSNGQAGRSRSCGLKLPELALFQLSYSL